MQQDNMQIVRRFFDEHCNKRRPGVADEIFSPDHTYHDPSSPWIAAGPAGIKELIGVYHSAVNDALWDVHAMMQAGDIVITRWTGRGTHTGDFFGIAPTGRKVNVDGIWMHRVVDGKIVESWNCWDMYGLLQQLGVLPILDNTKHAA